ncbi:MAG TPA: adenylate/guanylate cyclase domain-containing protein [Sporichthya sp.]|nr:adenylate/guanylate cyclase domain-containing protein [Sporichthya sp.]
MSGCRHANRSGAKFCSTCGSPLALTCPICGTATEAGAAFCDECGTRLGAPAAAPARPVPEPARATESERKQVTVLFADLAGSMELAERFDADTWTQIVTGLFEAGAEAVRRYGGTVDKFTGDGLMALFGAPVALEDHAARAAHAALGLLAAAGDYAAKARAEHGIDLHVRVGLNSGEVVAGNVGASGFTAVGHTVGLAQRMESIAELNTVRLSEHTARLLRTGFALRDLGAVDVKGSAVPVRTFALGAATTGLRRRGGTARMVGRDTEWASLLAALDAANSGHGQVVGIVGEAGAGKSRLTEELARLATDRGVLVRRTAGVSHATSAPLLPIRALFLDYFGVTDTDSATEVRAKVAGRALDLDPDVEDELPLLFDFLDVPDPDRPIATLGPEARRRRVLEVVRRLTRRRSAQVTLIFIMEDLHWFDEHSVRFLDEWLPSFLGTRTLIVTNFRPEFRAPWVSRSYYRQIPLPALDPDAVDAMVTDLVGTDVSLRTLGEELAERAGGNPFFVEEIVRGWVEDGTLDGSPGAYVLGRPVDTIRVPSTVQSVLADRIDRLGGRNKSVLQAASVVGRTFSLPVLRFVTGLQKEQLDPALTELCAAELLQEHDEQEYRFWHPLTQEVAYNGLLGATRRRHHHAVAEALTQTSPGRHDELAAVVASHLEAADDHLEAARWQVRAGLRANRINVPEAIRLLRCAVAHLDEIPLDADTAALSVRAHGWLLRFGARAGIDPAEAEDHIVAARRAVEQLADPVASTMFAMATAVFRYFTGNHAGSLGSFEEARRFADQTDDRDLQAYAHGAGCAPFGATGPVDAGIARLAYARELCGEDTGVGMVYAGYSMLDTVLFLGASVEIEAGLLDAARADLVSAVDAFRQRPMSDWQVWTFGLVALLADATGLPSDLRFARSFLADAHRIADEAGSAIAKVRALQASAVVALLEGDPESAEVALTEGLDLARGSRAGLVEEASMLVHLARARLAAGDLPAAAATAAEALETALRQGARVVACSGHLVHAQVLRATDPQDSGPARAALDAGMELAEEVQARSWAACLAEERARLDGGDLAAVAGGYDAIGATGHAARIRAELAG